MKRSLRARLVLLWVFIAVTGVSLAIIMFGMYRQGAGFQIEAGQQSAKDACTAIQDQYALYAAGPDATKPPARDLLYVLVNLALREKPGVEGGIWHVTQGFIAYAYPTYEGGGIKRDVPEVEQPRIAGLAADSLSAAALRFQLQRGAREASIVAACPLPGNSEMAAWTLKRVPAALAGVYDRLTLGLGVLLLFVVGSGVWLGAVLYRWSRRLIDLERAVSKQNLDHLPQLPPTGEQELDRIVDALNQFSERLRGALEESAKLGKQLAQADRLAALGRMTAALAHEIRNPIAAMRLKAENAIAQPGPRQQSALQAILEQIERLDKLLGSMLSMTQPLALNLQRVGVAEWLDERVRGLRETAQRQGVGIVAHTEIADWSFDPLHLGRALENLLWNSLQHCSEGGEIRVDATASADAMVLRVSDNGSGVAEEMKERLFEPFASGRTDGTGLGLALVREIAGAHGGSARYVQVERGACFELILPWRAS
jgi:signal transduction histidine kinase